MLERSLINEVRRGEISKKKDPPLPLLTPGTTSAPTHQHVIYDDFNTIVGVFFFFVVE